MSFRIPRRDTDVRFVTKFGENRPLLSCRKVVCMVYHTNNSGSAGLVPALIFPKIGRSRPKFPERCHPLTFHVHRIWSGSAAFCRIYSKKIDFSAQKVNTI